MTRDMIMEAEPKCVECGKNEFKLLRTVDSQILAECVNCGEPHILDAIDIKTGNTTNLQWFSPKMEQEKKE